MADAVLPDTVLTGQVPVRPLPRCDKHPEWLLGRCSICKAEESEHSSGENSG